MTDLSASPDWQALWRFGVAWAGRPLPGLRLPGAEQASIMRQVFAELMQRFPQLPPSLQLYGFIQQQAVALALAATREARRRTGNAGLWHEVAEGESLPAVDLELLQAFEPRSHANDRAWQELATRLKPRAVALAKGALIGPADAEDLFIEALADLTRQRGDGSCLLQQLQVFEQLLPTFLTVVKRRTTDFLRHQTAQRRDVRLVEQPSAVAEAESAYSSVDALPVAAWAAAQADPLHGLTFARIAQECGHCLTALQQRILVALYVEESQAYMEVAESDWFAEAVNLKVSASAATRRRALDREHDSALSALAQCLGL